MSRSPQATTVATLSFIACLASACGTPNDPALISSSLAPSTAPTSRATNLPPIHAHPGGPTLLAAGSIINFDAARHAGFRDADGDALSYELTFASPDLGLVIQGTRVLGLLAAPGVVNFKLVARDGYGGEGELEFSLAAAGPEPPAPILPATRYHYEDALLPPHLRNASGLGDTNHAGNRVSNAGATLGRVLFYDKRLSITNTHSCGSCHRQAHGFAASERFPSGVTHVPLKRNAMGLTNVRYTFGNRYFADERVQTLEALATMPIEAPDKLGNSLELLEAKLAATDFYPELFRQAFGSPEVTRERIAKALAQFLRSIVSYQTTFDAAGGSRLANVYSDREAGGALFFETAGCGICHGTAAHVMSRARNNGLDAIPADVGAGGGRFRAASLRNVAATAPYMHDGRFATLREVIDHYDHGVIDSPLLDERMRTAGNSVKRFDLSDSAKDDVEAFLRALTDQAVLTDVRWSDPFP